MDGSDSGWRPAQWQQLSWLPARAYRLDLTLFLDADEQFGQVGWRLCEWPSGEPIAMEVEPGVDVAHLEDRACAVLRAQVARAREQFSPFPP